MRRDYFRLLTLAIFSLAVAALDRDLRSDERQDLLDAFRKADVPRRLEMLPRLTAVYRDEDLPPEARYLVALQLLRPHLTWHLPHLIPWKGSRTEKVKEVSSRHSDTWRWGEALGAEEWMFGDVPAEVREQARRELAAWQRERKGESPKPAAPGDFAWRIKDPTHADVARALRLLSGISEGDLGRQAQRWVEEIGRNNTVLTLDVTGSYGAGKPALVVLDVRNATRVTCKLYRVARPEDLLWVSNRIGEDFVFCDHGLEYDQKSKEERIWKAERMHAADRIRKKARAAEVVPEALKKAPLWKSKHAVAELKVGGQHHWEHHSWHKENEYRAGDGSYFGDLCEQHRRRLEKRYLREAGDWTSWQCNRIIEVPGKALTEAGAYVLAVEAGGQTIWAPLLVEPLSLTLRRCRDGVFVAVADTEGKNPVEGATVHGRDMLGTAQTDAEGIAFAKLYAGGDRAVIVHKDGRFAIGGFGRVFEGIYFSALDRKDRWGWRGEAKEGKSAEEKARTDQALIYADRHVVAAYTDRPTYRPDQEVQLKVIVRRLAPEKPPTPDSPRTFRAEDFEFASRLELPEYGTRVPFALLDPKGRAVAEGMLTLNDFGTAAGSVRLSAEAAVGTYALRLRLGGIERIVPEVCRVEYYRLPSFKLTVKGVPEKVRQSADFRVELSGEYYFGKPVAGGHAEARLTRIDSMRSVCWAEATLDAAGKAALTLKPGKGLPVGRYVVRCDLSDESGRSVQQVLPYTVEAPEQPRSELAALPRFVPLDKPLNFPTKASVVLAEQVRRQWGDPERITCRFVPERGSATLRFPAPGWYTLTADRDQADVFVYGGTDRLSRTLSTRQNKLLHKTDQTEEKEPDEWAERRLPGWVDLTDDRNEPFADNLFDRRGSHLPALFDRQEVKVGDKLRVLVQVPAAQARLLFTMEGYTVLDYFTARVENTKGYFHVIEIPITRRHLPHFYLRGRILEGEHFAWKEQELPDRKWYLDKPGKGAGRDLRRCRIDVIDPNALPGGETLRVEMKTDRTEYRPGESVNVRVKVTDRAGKPAAAEVSLAAVDASVYAFGEDRLGSLAGIFDDPHPAQLFHDKAWRGSHGNRWALMAKRAQQVDQEIKILEELKQAAESKAAKGGESKGGLAAFQPELASVLPGEMPVASMPLSRLRSDFRETAAWLPQLRTNTEGELTTTFKLPDSLTRYRLNAVALTKRTEIGTSRAEVRASLPLAVQVILPRFAVEGDRVAAIGIVHNNGPRDRVCSVAWQVEGASMDGQLAANTLDEWKQDRGQATGKRTIPAGKTARIGLWLKFDCLGKAVVHFRCADGADGDAEVRSLLVQPLGRERSVSFDGAFTGSTKVRLPAGFTAHDVAVVLARNNVARSLDGIAALVEYPHGCVEQTMSRFLPAVLVREATRRGPLTLPLDIQAKLPLVLEQGLTRLYKFQHADGGWGWWETDKTDPRMTVYVVYGLAHCASAGVTVDAGVLSRGTEWLKTQLRDGGIPAPLTARAFLALAHANLADAAALRPFAEQLLAKGSPAESCCLTALACQRVGLQDLANRLWAKARDWNPESAEEIALLLKAQITFGEPALACQRSAGRLMKLRTGLGWDNTQATAAALDALSLLIPSLTAEGAVSAVRVIIGGKEALSLSKPEDLKAPVYRARLGGEKLPIQDPLEIELAAEGNATVYYTVEAQGTQRQDKVEPIGDAIKVSRTFETLAGQPLTGKVTVGQTLAVRLQVVLEKPCAYVLIEDRRPAGCEFADKHLYGKDSAGLANVEFRDDRVCAFAASLPAGRHEFVYFLRAETPGVSQVLPGRVYPMYQDRIRGETGAARLEIISRKSLKDHP